MQELGIPALGTVPPDDARAVQDEAAANVFGPVPDVACEDRALPGPAGTIPVRVYRPGRRAGCARARLLPRRRLGARRPEHAPTASARALADARRLRRRARSTTGWRPSTGSRPRSRTPGRRREWVAAQRGRARRDGRRASRSAATAPAATSRPSVALQARDEGLPLSLQLLVYPVTDADLRHRRATARTRDGYCLTAASMGWFWDHYLARRRRRWHPDASPLRADDAERPAAGARDHRRVRSAARRGRGLRRAGSSRPACR